MNERSKSSVAGRPRIVDRLRFVACFFDLTPVLEHFAQPLLHFVGGLVGKRHPEDAVARNTRFDQMGNPVRDDAGLAGAGPRQHQQRAGQRVDGSGLIWIQTTHETAFGFRNFHVNAAGNSPELIAELCH